MPEEALGKAGWSKPSHMAFALLESQCMCVSAVFCQGYCTGKVSTDFVRRVRV